MTLEEMLAEAGITEMEIMRYADGVLAPEKRPVVRAALARYPELMQLLESFLFTRGPLVEAYDEVLDAPIPARIMKLVQPRREPASFRDLINVASWPRFRVRAPVFAVAALAAVALAAWLMNYVTRYEFIPPERQGVAAPPALQQALDQTPMRAPALLADGASIVPQLTFYSRLNQWCREFATLYGDRAVWQGRLACRGSDGVWRVRTETDPLPFRPDAQAPDAGTRPAGEAGMGILATARDDLKVGDMLGAAVEADLIRGGWQRKP
jgi:hypothetical protein